MKKKAIKLAAASAVAASAFVASAPAQTDAASNVAAEVSKAVTQMKKAYHTYSDVTAKGEFADIKVVYKEYNAAKAAYNNAKALVNKAGGSKKDAYLAQLDSTYADYITKRVVTYIDAYNYAKKLEEKKVALEKAIADKDLVAAEKYYHEISYELKTRTVILDRVYGKSTRDLLRAEFKTAAQDVRDSLIYDVTVAMKLRAAEEAVNKGDLATAEKALAAANEYLPKVTETFKAELTAENTKVKAAYEAALTPKVESVSAINAKQVKVTFNVELDKDSAENLANYTFGLQGALSTNVVDGTGASAVLQSDGKSVLLTLEDAAVIANDTTSNAITVKNIKSKSGIVLADTYTNGSVALKDSALPTLVKIEQTGSKQIKLVFNEPVRDADGNTAFDGNEVVIDGGAIPVASITADVKGYALLVNTYADIADGEHTVKVVSNAIEDFVGLHNLEQSMKFTAVKDSTVPTVTVKSASADKVTLKFNKKVAIPGHDNVAFRAVYNNSGNQVLASTNATSILNPDGTQYTAGTLTDEVVIDFPQVLPPGNVSIFIEYVSNTDTTNVIKDGYGITLPEQTLVANIVTDTVKPTVTKVEAVSSTTIDVTFSEEVDATTAQNIANYKVTDTKGSSVQVTGAVLQTGNKRVRLTTANLDGGTYNITVKGVKDRAVPTANTMDDFTTTFTATDSKAPTATAQYVNGDGVNTKDKIVIKFSEAMATSGAGSVADKGNYQYTVDGTNWKSLGANDKVEVSADSKTVTITLADDVTFSGTPANNKVKFGAVTDLAGNKLNNTVGHMEQINPAAVGILSAKFTATDKLEVVFDSVLSNVSASEFELVSDVNGSSFTGANAITLSVFSHTVEDGKSKVVFSLNKNVDTDGQYQGVDVALKVNGATNTKTADGIVVGNLAYNATFADEEATPNKVADKIVPKLVSTAPIKTADVDANGKIDHIVVTFSEAVQAGTISVDKFTVSGYTVTDAYASTTVPTSATARTGATVGNADTVYIRVTEKDNPDYTAAPTVTIGSGIKDVAGNVFTFSETSTTPLAGSQVAGVTSNITRVQGSAAAAPAQVTVGGFTFDFSATSALNGYKVKLGTVSDGTLPSATVDTTNKLIVLNGDFDNTTTAGMITATQAKTAIDTALSGASISATVTVGGTPTDGATTGSESVALSGGADNATESVTITFSGTATSAGQLVVTVGNKLYYVAVANGDNANTIAANVRAAIAANAPTGYNVSVSGAAVTLTSTTANTDVTDLAVSVN